MAVVGGGERGGKVVHFLNGGERGRDGKRGDF